MASRRWSTTQPAGGAAGADIRPSTSALKGVAGCRRPGRSVERQRMRVGPMEPTGIPSEAGHLGIVRPVTDHQHPEQPLAPPDSWVKQVHEPARPSRPQAGPRRVRRLLVDEHRPQVVVADHTSRPRRRSNDRRLVPYFVVASHPGRASGCWMRVKVAEQAQPRVLHDVRSVLHGEPMRSSDRPQEARESLHDCVPRLGVSVCRGGHESCETAGFMHDTPLSQRVHRRSHELQMRHEPARYTERSHRWEVTVAGVSPRAYGIASHAAGLGPPRARAPDGSRLLQQGSGHLAVDRDDDTADRVGSPAQAESE